MSCLSGVQCKTCPCPPGFCAIDPCTDVDHDGFVPGPGTTCSGKHGGDCNDTNAAVNPAAAERCSNGIDDDCDGRVDLNDPQCSSCMGGPSCASAFDCQLGQSFCTKSTGGTRACCELCPIVDAVCAQGYLMVAGGIEPLTGCQQATCVPDTGLQCPENYAPVCSTTGQTYGNLCELGRAQATLLHTGACVPGEGLDCGISGQTCGTSGALYCRDACPQCDAWLMRCTKVGVCMDALDCPAGAPPPPMVCADGSPPRPSCVSHACQYSCP